MKSRYLPKFYLKSAIALLSLVVAVLLLNLFVAPSQAQSSGGTVTGRVIDRNNGRSLPNTVMVVGWDNIQLATLTDAQGRYTFNNVPPAQKQTVIAFLAGYTYLLQEHDIVAGRTVTADFGIIPEPDPQLIPTISDPKISVGTAEPGQEVTFSMIVKAGSAVPLSPEVMVMNPVLGKAVLLTNVGDLWTGKFKLPDNIAPGKYDWTFFAVDWVCREPSSFPVLSLNVVPKRFFPETGKTVPGVFMQYWNTRGGLPIYGYPISDALQEVSPTDGKTYLVQYFERNRFEYHPENAGTPFEVLLGLLGKQVTAGRENEPPFRSIPAFPSTAAKTFFAETGHSLGNTPAFKSYWEKNGGLAQFGFPISEEFQEVNAEDGKTYIVQYFERARFEYHPEFAGTSAEVLLGLLGKQVYKGN